MIWKEHPQEVGDKTGGKDGMPVIGQGFGEEKYILFQCNQPETAEINL